MRICGITPGGDLVELRRLSVVGDQEELTEIIGSISEVRSSCERQCPMPPMENPYVFGRASADDEQQSPSILFRIDSKGHSDDAARKGKVPC